MSHVYAVGFQGPSTRMFAWSLLRPARPIHLRHYFRSPGRRVVDTWDSADKLMDALLNGKVPKGSDEALVEELRRTKVLPPGPPTPKPKLGRPRTGLELQQICVTLDQPTIKGAIYLGDGNISKGLRKAVEIATQPQMHPAVAALDRETDPP